MPSRASPLRLGSQSRLGEWKSRSTQVGGMSIAGCSNARQSSRNCSRSAGSTSHAEARHEPVEQQLGLDQERLDVVVRNPIFDMRRDHERVGQLHLMQRTQRVDRGLVAFLDGSRRIAGDHALVAQVLDEQQPLVEIGVQNGGRREAALAQSIRHRDERDDALGKMRDRAVGLAVADRRAVRPPRRVHQDHLLLAEREPLVGARRSIALDARAHRVAVAAFGDELAHPSRCGRRAAPNEP